MKFDSILVANRGEIACRILRTARELGYRTIAIYSDVDRAAPHVMLADEAVSVGPSPAAQSYLHIPRILEAAARTAAGAVHPGYGFLSENPAFARACEEDGRVFIGPPADAIELMGNKAAAKRHMLAAGIPCIPGYAGGDQDNDSLVAAAREIGWPVMVKAAAGGGGRGMRRVTGEHELIEALRLVRSEARSAFGTDELILEKAMSAPRHVEVQVLADAHGNVIHLGERDCSIQRRHQKVVEEAPCPIMNASLREHMGETAVEVARSIAYVGAGTVEFLLDEGRRFYFLEMNTRLQVEHPVTEMLTGLDLVERQIAVAQGEELGVGQKDVSLDGHAIEVRLYAEDPERDFVPSTGRIDLWRRPEGAGIRVDDGIESGAEVSPFYDAMLAKIVAAGPTREVARRRLLRALNETALFGPSTNLEFIIGILRHDEFAAGSATTAFIDKHIAELIGGGAGAFHRLAIAAVLAFRRAASEAMAATVRVSRSLLNWSSSGALESQFVLMTAEGEVPVPVTVSVERSHYTVWDADHRCTVEVLQDDGTITRIVLDGERHRVIYHSPSPTVMWLAMNGKTARYVTRPAGSTSALEDAPGGRICAPMPGLVQEVCVSPGDMISRGQRLLVLEAMKMQNEVLADCDGTVSRIHHRAGAQVNANELLLEIDVRRA